MLDMHAGAAAVEVRQEARLAIWGKGERCAAMVRKTGPVGFNHRVEVVLQREGVDVSFHFDRRVSCGDQRCSRGEKEEGFGCHLGQYSCLKERLLVREEKE